MIQLTVHENESRQRLDRFLRKYFRRAPLSTIYRLIRRDVKVNGRRSRRDYSLAAGDEITVYISAAQAAAWHQTRETVSVRRQFRIAYEDDEILAAVKPPGLLTHGNSTEKHNTLTAQVLAYLTASGAYEPRCETTFAPAPANRLDRNTSGLVLFGKTAAALRELNALLRERAGIRKFYYAVLCGECEAPQHLHGFMEKDEQGNRARFSADGGREMVTELVPLCHEGGFTLARLELLTGRTHQIRLQTAAAGYPVWGDPKYGDHKANRRLTSLAGPGGQLLHAGRLEFTAGTKKGLCITAAVPPRFRRAARELFPAEAVRDMEKR